MVSLAVRTFVFVPIFLLGMSLSAYGGVMTLFSLNRLMGLLYYSPLLLAGGLMICLSVAAPVALRRADRTVGRYFEERVRS